MSAPKHTPGPWTVNTTNWDNDFGITTEEGDVAAVFAGTDGHDDQAARANAHLIAAAPRMVDGLKLAVARLARVDGGDSTVIVTLLESIHEATGEHFDFEAFIAAEDAKAEGRS